jgi:ATP synthase subunit 6
MIIINSPLEQFEINKIIPFSISWFDLSLTNIIFTMIISTSIFIFFSRLSLKEASIIPNKWQAISEQGYNFVTILINEQIGLKGFKYFPFIYTLFFFILISNLIGMIPYNFTSTSHIVITFGLSLSVFIGVTIIGFQVNGLKFFSLFVPQGVPLALLPFIILIELVTYLTRGLSLSIRLAANMFAGHTLLKIISGFGVKMLETGGIIAIIGLAPIALLFALTGLELVIAFIQAYVFAVLTASYLNDAINLHH